MNGNQFLTWLDKKTQPARPIFEKPLIMGIVNYTPDSFSDGSAFASVDEACEQALALIEQGADIIDIGGESTQPKASPVPLDLELTRVIPIIECVRKHSDVCISIDTYKPKVMEEAVRVGANIINDIYALRWEGSLEMAAKLAVPVCLMHMQGNPQTMQEKPHYALGVVAEVRQFFEERILACTQAGIEKNKLILDPGFGFGKKVIDNLQLVNQLQYFKAINAPLLLGVSRKSTIGAVLNKKVNQRLIGSIALGVYAALQGVDVLRAHDVEETNQALIMMNAVCHAIE